MGSKREEERNEKIIRGLMKLPPNRRCINCNSLGPQYVCTNFWTFVCTTCSGIHREFTHRVKSVSMAKFTTQEVDALQKGGNQRARELYLKAWDLHRQRLPDNSNADKVREFIKNVYVDKKYAVEKSSDKPPRDPQSLRSHEDETRRASSYHSYSQSPPYDFQYEERRYGKHAPSLTRKGSDRGIYEGKLSNFLSPSRFSDHASDDRFANEGSNPRASDYSVSSGGGDPFRSDVLSPTSQRDIGNPFSETSRDFSSETQGHQTNLHNLKSVNSVKLQEVVSHSELPAETSHAKTSSGSSPPKSSTFTPFNGLDLFDAPFAPQNATSIHTNLSNSKLPESSLHQSVDLFQKCLVSSAPTFNEQKPSQTREPSVLDLFTEVSQQQPAASSNGGTSGVVTPKDVGWATFDMPQNVGPENSVTATVSSSGGTILGNFNPFSFDHSSSHQNSVSHEPSASTHTFWHDGLQNVETATNNARGSSHQNSVSHEPSASTHTFWHDGLQHVQTATNNTQYWNAFEDSAGQHPIQNVPKSAKQVAVHSASYANKSLGLGLYEAFVSDGNVRIPDEREPPPSILLHDFSMNPAVAGAHSLVTDHNKATNPFDIPFDSDMESSNMSQFWGMSSLQTALPNNQVPPSYVGGANQSWFPQNSVPSYVPGGVAFDFPTGSLGFISGQVPSAQIPNVPAQGSVASGNPFA